MNQSHQFIIFLLEGQRYALPLTVVERVVPAALITPLPKAPDVVLGVLDVEGVVLPVLSLRRRFRLPERETSVRDHFLLAHTGRRAVALVVDEVLSLRELMGAQITHSPGVAPGLEHLQGVATVEDGLILIYDLEAFLSLEEAAALDAALEEGVVHA